VDEPEDFGQRRKAGERRAAATLDGPGTVAEGVMPVQLANKVTNQVRADIDEEAARGRVPKTRR
jgi:hypothetical protein